MMGGNPYRGECEAGIGPVLVEAVRGASVDGLERDLLVAVLAIITDAVPRRALSDALSEWSRDRGRGLAQVLLRNGALDAQKVQALECLAEAHLERHQGDLRTCLDSWNALGMTQDALTAIDDRGLASTIGWTVASEATIPGEPGEVGAGETIARAVSGGETIARGPSGDETIAGPAGHDGGAGLSPGAAAAHRFRPIRPHARGGIGQVWVARDLELQREVALKVIQDRYADRRDQRARFLLEAEITGNLEHPGIVPVYSLGCDEQGRPYYAMRFIRGQSLATAIRQFHQRWRGAKEDGDGAPVMWGVEFRQLLGRFLDVCDAIDYAHSRGVLHRDLKPANIMLGRYGETLVVDWGLAKVIDRPDIVPVFDIGDAEPSLSGTGAGTASDATQPGTMIGTPSYMSPEQARGAVDEMGTASDVYSLGATLYEVLTGRPAFPGKEAADVIKRAISGDFRPPRAVLRSVPAPLESICLKAMAAERRDRYATVRELAVDIQHWLADEPVAAHVEGRMERAGRWLRRHRTWTFAAAAALIGITLAATIGVVVVERGRRREAEARALAEKNYRLARQAVEDYFTRVSEDTLLKEQDSVDMRRLREKLLRTALGYYREFLNQRSGDPEVRRELADAQYRVGRILREIDAPDAVVAAYAVSIGLWKDLLTDAPGDPALRAGLARSYLGLGEQQAQVRKFPLAFDAMGRAREILARLRDERRGDAAIAFVLADCNKELGIAEAEAGELDPGLSHLIEAEVILSGLLREAPENVEYRRRLAETVNGQGFIYFERGRDLDALRQFRAFQEIARKLFDEDRTGARPAAILDKLATSYYNMGAILYRQARPPAVVLEHFEKALEYRKALAEAHPSVIDYREGLAVIYSEVAPYRHYAGLDEEAIEAAGRSVEMLEKLVEAQPGQPRYRAELGRSLNILGYLADERRDNRRALALFRRALAEADSAVERSPETDRYRRNIVDILQNLGEQFFDLGTPDEGLPHLRRAVAIGGRLLDARPDDRGRRLDLVDQLAVLAKFERQGGRAEDAERDFGRAVAALEPLVPPTADADVQVRRGELLTGQGRAAADRGKDAEALALFRHAIEILTPFCSFTKEDPRPRSRLTEALWEAARVLRRTGQADEAASLDAQRWELWRGPPPGGLGALAIAEAKLSATVGYGLTPADERVEAVRRLDLDLAAENLRMAVALGFRDHDMLHGNRDAAPLLSRPDVRPLLDDIAFPEDPLVPERRSP